MTRFRNLEVRLFAWSLPPIVPSGSSVSSVPSVLEVPKRPQVSSGVLKRLLASSHLQASSGSSSFSSTAISIHGASVVVGLLLAPSSASSDSISYRTLEQLLTLPQAALETHEHIWGRSLCLMRMS